MSLHAEPKTAAQSLALHLETNYGLQLDPARHGLLCADLDQHLRAYAAAAGPPPANLEVGTQISDYFDASAAGTLPTNLAVGTVYYTDGTSATGVLPLPDTSPGGAPRVRLTVPEPDVTAELDAAGPPAIEQQPPAQEPPNAAA
jgi:hypothetical protein